MNPDALLVVNAGSSSLKFSLFGFSPPDQLDLQFRGHLDRGSAALLEVRDSEGHALEEVQLAVDERPDIHTACAYALDWLATRLTGRRLVAVGHRIVHGGEEFSGPVRLTPKVLENLQRLVPLAPLHQPFNLSPVQLVADRFPGVPQIGCFDTAFHHSHSPVADLVPLPAEITRGGLRRYGFHGLSYEHVTMILSAVAPEVAGGRMIVAHLGSGASLCAIREGKSVDCTLGFSALDGLCMGTRPGTLDPGVILYLLQSRGLSVQEVEEILYRGSGLLGISGISPDMRDLLASDHPRARLAVDYFVYRAVKEIGALAAVLGGLDALVFTAGVGENSPEIRRRICEGSAWLGVKLDGSSNQESRLCISRPGSVPQVLVVPANEELTIARHTVKHC